MANNKKKTTNGIVFKNGKYFMWCGDKLHEFRTQGRIKYQAERIPIIAPTKRMPVERETDVIARQQLGERDFATITRGAK